MGNMEQVRDELRRDLQIGDVIDYSGNPTVAQIVPGVIPHWYLIETHPNRERTAAAHLISRRFGVFMPEKEETIVRRGRKLDQVSLMFRGYIFVFVWGMMKHLKRIEAVPGVSRVVFIEVEDGAKKPGIVTDEQIDQIRAVENQFRPLKEIMVEEIVKPKRRMTNRQKMLYRLQREQAERDNEIVACRAWSPFQDSLMTLDSDGRNQTLRNALGLAA